MAGLEDALAPRRVRGLRFAWAIVLTVLIAASSALTIAAAEMLAPGTADSGFTPVALARIAAAYFAVGLLTAVFLGNDLGWTTPVLLVTALVFFGRDREQVVRDWAILLTPGNNAAPALMVLALAILAAACYARWDTRGLALWRD